MTPEQAGFDGAKGVRVPAAGEDFRYKLRLGKESPSSFPESDFTEQLLWFYPDNAAPQLLWCNADDQWFNLFFVPIEKP
jgi:hypothetical protein